VTFAHTGRNQHDDVVATAHRKTMVRMQPAEPAGGEA
jgi:acyl dehydratase